MVVADPRTKVRRWLFQLGLEAELRVNTALLLNMVGIKNRDGVIPDAKVAIRIRGVDVEGLSGYRIGEGGEITLSDKSLETEAQNLLLDWDDADTESAKEKLKIEKRLTSSRTVLRI